MILRIHSIRYCLLDGEMSSLFDRYANHDLSWHPVLLPQLAMINSFHAYNSSSWHWKRIDKYSIFIKTVHANLMWKIKKNNIFWNCVIAYSFCCLWGFIFLSFNLFCLTPIRVFSWLFICFIKKIISCSKRGKESSSRLKEERPW